MGVLKVITLIIVVVLIIAQLFCLFMLCRSEWVYSQRTKLLYSDYDKYKKLPDYDIMVNKFWVWNVNKFIKEENE